MVEKLTITQWAEEDRPREKMMLHGVSALSNAELLAILIGSGNTEDSAVVRGRNGEVPTCSVDAWNPYSAALSPAMNLTLLATTS